MRALGFVFVFVCLMGPFRTAGIRVWGLEFGLRVFRFMLQVPLQGLGAAEGVGLRV